MRVIEGKSNRTNIVDCAGHNGKHPRNEQNECDGGTDA